MTHNYFGCARPLQNCRWCRLKAEKLARQEGFDIQELDYTLTFNEQPMLQKFKEHYGGFLSERVVQILVGSKKAIDLSDIIDGFKEMGFTIYGEVTKCPNCGAEETIRASRTHLGKFECLVCGKTFSVEEL